MGKPTKPRQEIVRRIKAREEADKRENYTFRLSKKLMDAFRERCEKDDVSMASAVQMMLEDFTRD